MKMDNVCKFIRTLVLCVILPIACTKSIVIPVIISDPADHNMKITPSNPTTSDYIKLVVYNDCQYNILTGITLNGNTVQIVKQFNSRIMIPCFITNDTINIGRLPKGSYLLNYKLLDNATSPPKATLNLNFSLVVSP